MRMQTGELRSRLQPLVFLHLLQPVKEYETEKMVFSEGQMVAAQYWGGGLVSLTSVSGEKHMAVAHDINAAAINVQIATNE